MTVVARDLVLHPPVAALTRAVVALNLATRQQVAVIAEGVTTHVLALHRSVAIIKDVVVAVPHLVPEYNPARSQSKPMLSGSSKGKNNRT